MSLKLFKNQTLTIHYQNRENSSAITPKSTKFWFSRYNCNKQCQPNEGIGSIWDGWPSLTNSFPPTSTRFFGLKQIECLVSWRGDSFCSFDLIWSPHQCDQFFYLIPLCFQPIFCFKLPFISNKIIFIILLPTPMLWMIIINSLFGSPLNFVPPCLHLQFNFFFSPSQYKYIFQYTKFPL